MKKLLIMGANPETVSLVLKARKMGIYTIVTDYEPSTFAKKYADQDEKMLTGFFDTFVMDEAY